ncbi:large ribosomal subunit protein bL28m-like [Styela clava]
MPRPSTYKVPLPAFKGRVGFQIHKVPRDDFFDNPAVKFPIYNRLPETWRKEFEKKPPLINQKLPEATKRPHHKGLWFRNQSGQPEIQSAARVEARYTKEVLEGLWGGEGIVEGRKYPPKMRYWTRLALGSKREWRPHTFEKSFHSQILNKKIKTTVTPRTLDLIDAAYGFDHYILKTPINELCSNLGGQLKRDMLLQLCNKDQMYPYDADEREKIYNEFKKYIIPADEAEWVGLTLEQAMWKQWYEEKQSGAHDSVPLLDIYTQELKEKLKIEGSDVDGGKGEPETPSDSVVIFNAPQKAKI